MMASEFNIPPYYYRIYSNYQDAKGRVKKTVKIVKNSQEGGVGSIPFPTY